VDIWFYSILSVVLVSAVSLVGVFTLSLSNDKLRKITFILVSFAVGALLGDAFIHLIPEAFEKFGSSLTPSMYIIAGVLFFFLMEKFIRWRHCHITNSTEHLHPVVTMNLVGDGVHNLIDGMVIGASYIVSLPIGIATTLAVLLHEIPQEIGDFSILVHGGLSVKKALAFNFLSALTAILGAVLSLLIGPSIEGYASALLPITAGGFIYIAGSDLIPELHHDVKVSTSLWQFILITLGIGIMALLILFE
jgi:zinc and cadmium transporter